MADDDDSTRKVSDSEIEALLAVANESIDQAQGNAAPAEPAAAAAPAGGDPSAASATATPFPLGELEVEEEEDDSQTIDLINDVEMDLRIELGRTTMRLDEVLQLRGGSVVTLDKLAGDPVDVFANGRLIARGEVLVMNDNFCVRVTELVSG